MSNRNGSISSRQNTIILQVFNSFYLKKERFSAITISIMNDLGLADSSVKAGH